MNLLKEILSCKDETSVNKIISKQILEINKNSGNIDQLGFLNYGQFISTFKGFIPLHTRIKYDSGAIETYGMETTDFFYEFAMFVRKYNISNIFSLIQNLELFINYYFDYPKDIDRTIYFRRLVLKGNMTDNEFFDALDNLKIEDLKKSGAALCTERAALAQQILSLFGIETYYCFGCIEVNNREIPHCFNIVKRKKDYALLDYSMPVTKFNEKNSAVGYFPFIGIISDEEFEDFIKNGKIKTFNDYHYTKDQEKVLNTETRSYVIGSFEMNLKNTR